MGSPKPLVGSGSAGRGKKFVHIPPGYWSSQTKVYSTVARSAREIITEACNGSVGGGSVGFHFHAAQSKPVFSVNANSGMTVAAFLQQMAEAQGLQITMDGSHTIRFARRGEGALVLPSNAHLRRDGNAMSAEPTKVRVVGGRRLVQVNEVPLVADWNRKWEKFMAEPAWLAEVKLLMSSAGPLSEDAAMRAEVAARAREITLAHYIALKGLTVSNPADLESEYADNGRWGQVSRMDMPVWQYLNSIVFRSYRIAADAELYGLPMRSLEIYDRLLCAVTTTENGDNTRIVYREDPLEFYPQSSAFVIAKGQPLDLACAEQTDGLIRQRNKNLRDVWSEIPEFTVDADNHAIRFATPVFLDGDPNLDESILLYPNRGQGGGVDLRESLGSDSESTYLDVVVPNPGFKIEPAEVRVALVFVLGLFYKDFGAGARWTCHHASSIAEHLLHGAEGFNPAGVSDYEGDAGVPDPPPEGFLEILMEDGKSAVEAAAEQSEGLIVRSGIEASGEYVRHGIAGTNLTGSIDRVTTRLTTAGLEETVEFAKPRPSRGFVSSREAAERVKNEELYDGQKELQREVRDLRAIARSYRAFSSNEKPRTPSLASIPDVLRKPVGAMDAEVRTIPDPNSQWPDRGSGQSGWLPGDLVWLDDKDLPSRTGQRLGGVVTMKSMREGEGEESTPVKFVTVAKSGTVPCAVVPGTSPGPVMANPGDWKASSSGSWPVGVLAHATSVPGEESATLALVSLGGGGTSASGICYFGEIVTWEDGSSSGAAKTGVRGGIIEGGEDQWWEPNHEIATTPDREKLLWIELEILTNTTSDGSAVLSGIKNANRAGIQWVEGDVSSPMTAKIIPPIFPPSGVTPGAGKISLPIGIIKVAAGAVSLTTAGCGHFVLTHCPGGISYERRSDLSASSSSSV
jgi:hypothetical protein